MRRTFLLNIFILIQLTNAFSQSNSQTKIAVSNFKEVYISLDTTKNSLINSRRNELPDNHKFYVSPDYCEGESEVLIGICKIGDKEFGILYGGCMDNSFHITHPRLPDIEIGRIFSRNLIIDGFYLISENSGELTKYSVVGNKLFQYQQTK